MLSGRKIVHFNSILIYETCEGVCTDKSARLLYLPSNVTQSRCDACPECCKNPGKSAASAYALSAYVDVSSLLGLVLTLVFAALTSCLLSF